MTTIFSVSESASLTLSGNVVIDGEGLKKNESGKSNGKTDGYGVIDVAGTLTIKDDVEVKNCIIGWASGVINVHGTGATFNLYGGSICDNTADFDGSTNTNTFGGTVRLYTGATMNMTGGAIKNNKVTGYYTLGDDGEIVNYSLSGLHQSAGIFANGSDVSVNITGGEIAENVSQRGSAIYVYGIISAPVVNISGSAKICNNSYGEFAYYDEYFAAAGAVYVEYWGTVNMSGGRISNNKGFSGGGVTLLSYWLGSQEYVSAKFNMTGGTIEGNTAQYGGGIYSYSKGVNISGGKIINNTAEIGGGIYSEGNSTSYGVVYLTDVVIHDNIASLQGGGVWLCPTGEFDFYITSGGAIYDNNANYDLDSDYYNETDTALNGGAAGDDFASGAENLYHVYIESRNLGGGKRVWYNDGGVGSATDLWPDELKGSAYWDSETNTSTWPYPVVDQNIARHSEDTKGEERNIIDGSDYYALKSESVEDGNTLAQKLSKVEISGNTATYGGGIGANGGVVIGEEDADLISIKVSKVWEDYNNKENTRPDSIKVNLLNEGYVIDTLELNEENNWSGEFTELSSEYTYTIEEEPIDVYVVEITGDQEEGFTITNTYIAEEDIIDGEEPNDQTLGETQNNKESLNPITGDIIMIAIAILVIAILGLIITVKIREKLKNK